MHSNHALTIVAIITFVFGASRCERSHSAAPPTAPTTGGMFSSPAGIAGSQVRGVVTDGIGQPLDGAQVAVVDGNLAGTKTVTDAAGQFELSGGTGTTTLSVTKDGFEPKTQTVNWKGNTVTNVTLQTVGPQLAIEPGNFDMTLAADLSTVADRASCAGFPANLVQTTFPVTISVTTVSSRFAVRARNLSPVVFTFGVAGQMAGFQIERLAPFDVFPGIFPGPGAFTISSSVSVRRPVVVVGSTITIPFSGV